MCCMGGRTHCARCEAVGEGEGSRWPASTRRERLVADWGCTKGKPKTRDDARARVGGQHDRARRYPIAIRDRHTAQTKTEDKHVDIDRSVIRYTKRNQYDATCTKDPSYTSFRKEPSTTPPHRRTTCRRQGHRRRHGRKRRQAPGVAHRQP